MPSQKQLHWSELRVGITVVVAAIALATLIFLMTSAQGLFTTAETAAIAVAAAVSGYLFSLARWTPFVVAAAIAVGLTATLPVLWRDVAGKVAPEPTLADHALDALPDLVQGAPIA